MPLAGMTTPAAAMIANSIRPVLARRAGRDAARDPDPAHGQGEAPAQQQRPGVGVEQHVDGLRRGLPELAQREANEGNPTPDTQFSLSGAKERKKERWSKSHSPPFIQSQDAPAVLKNSITENSAAVSTASFLRDFVDLQHREITPEDYELLLQLDELVKKKMVSKAALDSFTVFTAEEGLTCEQCAVCLEQYCTGQELKQLPCSHFFHKDCIEQWLSTVSMNCPLDGLPV